MENETCLEVVTVNIVSFDLLQEQSRFLLVDDDGRLGTLVYQKAVWPAFNFNAVQERSTDRGLCTLKPEQRVVEVF